VTTRRPSRTRAPGERGFTMIEVLVAVVILTFALAGLLGLAGSSTRASGYARHAAEAAVVGSDKLERLRVVAPASLTDGTDQVDAHAIVTPGGAYTRTWTVSWVGTLATLIVQVSWDENGQGHSITYRTMRSTS